MDTEKVKHTRKQARYARHWIRCETRC